MSSVDSLRFGYIAPETAKNNTTYIDAQINGLITSIENGTIAGPPQPTPNLNQVLTAGNNTEVNNITVDYGRSILWEGPIQMCGNNEVPNTWAATNSIQLGNATTTASGINSLAIGSGASATHIASGAIGYLATSEADQNIAIGNPGQYVTIPGELRVGKWNGGMGYSNITQYVSFESSVNLSFSTAVYSNDWGGDSPVQVGSSGQIRLYNLNCFYHVTCRFALESVANEGHYNVVILHNRTEFGFPVVMNRIGTNKIYKGEQAYVSVSGVIYTSSDPTQYITCIVENINNTGDLAITEYHLTAFRMN